MFIGFLLLIFASYQYLARSSRRHSSSYGVLMNVNAHPQHISGVEHEERVHCPRTAQQMLHHLVGDADMRGIIHRDGSAWVVSTGQHLSLVPATHGTQSGVKVYYMRHHPPKMVNEQSVSHAEVPKELEGMVHLHHSAINPGALADVPGLSVSRHNNLTEALVAWSGADAEGETRYLYFNGTHDPVYHIVRTKKDFPNAIVTFPSLPGTVYMRK